MVQGSHHCRLEASPGFANLLAQLLGGPDLFVNTQLITERMQPFFTAMALSEVSSLREQIGHIQGTVLDCGQASQLWKTFAEVPK